MVVSIVLIGCLTYTVWAHHMLTVGLGPDSNTFIALTTMTIAVPTGIKIIKWLITVRGVSIHFTTPMLLSLGFIRSIFTYAVDSVRGGLSLRWLTVRCRAFPLRYFRIDDIRSVCGNLLLLSKNNRLTVK